MQEIPLLLRISDVFTTAPEASISYFRAQTKETKISQRYGITRFASLAGSVSMQAAMQVNFGQVRKEVKAGVQRYPNLYG